MPSIHGTGPTFGQTLTVELTSIDSRSVGKTTWKLPEHTLFTWADVAPENYADDLAVEVVVARATERGAVIDEETISLTSF